MPVFLVYFALLAVAFFFLIVRPQRRQLAARRALIQAVEVGDEIITAGGIYGVVREIDEETLRVEIAPGIEMTLAREAVARRREDPADTIDLADDSSDAIDPTDAASED